MKRNNYEELRRRNLEQRLVSIVGGTIVIALILLVFGIVGGIEQGLIWFP